MAKTPLEDWLQSLAADLSAADHLFVSASSTLDRQRSALASLAAVVDHIRNLPGVKGNTLALEAMARAMFDLTGGHSPQLLTNQYLGAGARNLSLGESSLKAKGVGLVIVLREAGLKEKDARREVAKWLAEAGFVGNRKRKPITASTLLWWLNEARNGEHPELVADAGTVSAVARTAGLVALGHWPPASDDETEVVKHLVRSAIGTPAK